MRKIENIPIKELVQLIVDATINEHNIDPFGVTNMDDYTKGNFINNIIDGSFCLDCEQNRKNCTCAKLLSETIKFLNTKCTGTIYSKDKELYYKYLSIDTDDLDIDLDITSYDDFKQLSKYGFDILDANRTTASVECKIVKDGL